MAFNSFLTVRPMLRQQVYSGCRTDPACILFNKAEVEATT